MWELHNMCLAAVDKVVKDDALLDAFEIPLPLRDAVKQSWQHKQPDLIGRFDLLVSGSEPPKLLEYNADTPRSWWRLVSCRQTGLRTWT
jgi:glutathionylspermidine synthase